MAADRAGTFGSIVIGSLVALAVGCGSSAPSPAATPDGGSGLPARIDATAPVADAPSNLPPPPPPPPGPPVVGDQPDVVRRTDGPPAKTCGDVRNCVAICAADTGCVQRCLDSAMPAARTAYQQADMCRLKYCKPDDVNCRCDQECAADANCFDVVDGCRNFENDLFCDEICR